MISLVRPAAFTRRVGVCEKRLDTSVSVHHSVDTGNAGLFRNQRLSRSLTVSFLLIVRHFLLRAPLREGGTNGGQRTKSRVTVESRGRGKRGEAGQTIK